MEEHATEHAGMHVTPSQAVCVGSGLLATPFHTMAEGWLFADCGMNHTAMVPIQHTHCTYVLWSRPGEL